MATCTARLLKDLKVRGQSPRSERREKQPVALDEEARPLLGPEDDTEGGVPGTPDFTVAHLKTRLCQPSTVSVAFTTSEMTNVSVSQGY